MADIVAKCRTGQYALSISCDPYSREHGLRLPYSDVTALVNEVRQRADVNMPTVEEVEGTSLSKDEMSDWSICIEHFV